jgi:hypothetical protein
VINFERYFSVQKWNNLAYQGLTKVIASFDGNKVHPPKVVVRGLQSQRFDVA